MRSLFVCAKRCRFGKSASLRKTSAFALLTGVALSSSLAVAAEPVVASDDPQTTSVTQSTTTTVTTNAPSVAVAPLPPPALAPTVIAPVPVAPPPPLIAPTVIAPVPVAPPAAPAFSGSFQGPIYFNGPVWIIPAQPGGQAMVQPALPSQLPPPPVYVQPPRLYAQPPRLMASQPLSRPRPMPIISRPAPRGPVFGMGVRFTTLGIRSQEVFGEKPTLMGGGVQLRFRNQGHWGFELALDAMKERLCGPRIRSRLRRCCTSSKIGPKTTSTSTRRRALA